MYALLRPFLFMMEAERAHHASLRLMDWGYRAGLSRLVSPYPKDLPTSFAGMALRHPVGMAAGLDKNGEYVDSLFALGFSFLEIGTVTPRPQPGNPQPRLFRLKEHEGVINRFGFNNLGVDALVRNVERARNRSGILGINIGKNKDTPNDNAVDDYMHCLDRVHAHADYITVNISSPNTEGLRALQEAESQYALLASLRERQLQLNATRRVPMFVKLAPDLSSDEVSAIATVLQRDVVDGVIATNTTLDRSNVTGHPNAQETGGLSGAPLLQRSNETVRELRDALGPDFPMIGVGGITTGADAASKITAGADVIQLYSGMVYHGPKLIRDSVAAIAELKS